jgi:YD repeat-containing protein
MHIKRTGLLLLLGIVFNEAITAQSAPPSSGNAMAASRGEAVSVNNFTGVPAIGVPLYSYAHKSGIGISVSLDYFAGGIKTEESPSPAGIGWNINAGGMITRTVRGIADDCPGRGFFYTPAIKNDPRDSTYKYYRGELDGEQDVFQFNFNGRSGKFYIGKDSQCIISPLTKMKIKFTKTVADPINSSGILSGSINQFVITAEDGVKYLFNEREEQSMVLYYIDPTDNTTTTATTFFYGTAWYLNAIVSLSADTIKFNYASVSGLPIENFYQSVKISGATVTHSDTSVNSPDLIASSLGNKVPSLISLPDGKKVSFVYSEGGQFRYGLYPVLQRVKIMDSVFRYGYMFNWDTANIGVLKRDFLRGIDWYDSAVKKDGYQFTYTPPLFTIPHVQNYGPSQSDSFLNRKDYWGYYNGALNYNEYVPTVPGVYTGANREPNASAVAGTLNTVKDPSGGFTYYKFENNDVYPCFDSAKTIIISNAAINTQSAITINKLLGKRTYMRVKLTGIRPTTTTPISGGGKLVVSFTNTAGTTTFATDTVDLYQLYYTGLASISCALDSGAYLLKTNLLAGTTSSGSIPLAINWVKQSTIAGTGLLSGGIRIKQISHFDPFLNRTDTLVTYQYVSTTGRSSGFLRAKPVYNYDFSGETIISSTPVEDMNYSNGNSTGYSRVEVIKGSVARNLGKTVYEYTDIKDFDFDNSPAEYPYMPVIRQEWRYGLEKRKLVYDNTNKLIQVSTNTYAYINKVLPTDSNYCSFKTGKVKGSVIIANPQQSNYYVGRKYYPLLGTVLLTNNTDTFYHPNNSTTVTRRAVEYDSNYNITKITTPYNLNANLNLEERTYYTNNYTLAAGVLKTLKDSSIFLPVSKETWITGDANPRLVSLSITDFQFIYPDPRIAFAPKATYSLQSNKPVPQTTIGLFNPSLLVRDASLIKQQQTLRYDGAGNLLETTATQPGVSKTQITGYAGTHIIAEVSNAKFNDVAYTSFEPNCDSTWVVTATGGLDSTAAITGKYCRNLSLMSVSRTGLTPAVTYIISYWTKGTVNITGATAAALLDTRNGWNLYTRTITGVSTVTVSGTGLLDELRLYPNTANMVTSCYNTNNQVSCTSDANNNIMYYEYDAAYRLKVIRDKDKNVIKKTEYSQLLTPINIIPVWQSQGSGSWLCALNAQFENTGNVNRLEIDTNPFSETYQANRYVFDHVDLTLCPIPPCPTDPAIKRVNGICETGCKIVTGTFQFMGVWKCVYHYKWSDNSVSDDIEEDSAGSCTLGPAGC